MNIQQKESPILFRDEMVKAYFEGRKTMTRRIIKVQPAYECSHGDYYKLDKVVGHAFDDGQGPRLCPYGKAGDRLWGRETWRAMERESDMIDGILYRADNHFEPIENSPESAELWCIAYNNGKHGEKWRPSIFLPRWASRILAEIVQIRVERLQDINEDDAKLEGVTPMKRESDHHWFGWNSGELLPPGYSYRDGFRYLWGRINGSGSWDENPFVWAISFKRISQEVTAKAA